MKENHHQQQKEHLLDSGDKNPIFRPVAHIHQIDHGLRRIYRVNQQMDQRIDQRDPEGQNAITDQAAEKIIPLACPQVHELCVIVKDKEERRHNRKQPGVISVA